MSKPKIDVGSRPMDYDGPVMDLPTGDIAVIAASIADREDVVGTIVVILRPSGQLEISCAGSDDEKKMKPLLDVGHAIYKHCETAQAAMDARAAQVIAEAADKQSDEN